MIVRTTKRLMALVLAGMLLITASGCSSETVESITEEVENLSSSGESYYSETIFDTSYIHEINVEISEDDWEDLLENPTAKTKYSVTVTIDGNTLYEVGFSTKGSTSLTSVATSDSDRYSFKLNFGKFIDGQTYDGLDKLALNNCYSDASYLKDYISYRIMAETGAAASLVSFVQLSINGEVYGLYLAIEEVDESFLERNYGEDYGELYKPESDMFDAIGGDFGMGNFNLEDFDFGDFDMGDFDTESVPESTPERPEDFDIENFDFGDMENINFADFGSFSSSNGADLVYTDDEITSYSDIFNNAKTDATEEDYERVIAALKQLSTGEDLETCVDVEATLRYFAAHNFTVNGDSYTGSMLHNYYLYEEDGVLTMIAWDYNLAYGGFSNSDASEAVNYPIDSPLDSGVSEDDRPMWSQLASNEEYLEMYHSYLDELVTNYFESGRFEEEFDALVEMIRPYVESDPTAFYTVEEFDEATATLKEFCLLRAESIRGQLDGTIPSTSEGQSADSSTLIDTGDMDLSVMGSMNTGGGIAGGFGGGGFDFGNFDFDDFGMSDFDGEMPDGDFSMGDFSFGDFEAGDTGEGTAEET
ncbi:MAG: CotH kinase family protein [Oscillospiraceae bacterium]|nr:CotH kinase family protein [Oscillospiraceae bacterium]